ncbi:MAG: hypothetical protein H0T62_10815 [Parachlamydiaceae bacterium]|nr:hypothetical protein [Parachlamydiaceae bacterium]
MHDRKRHDDQDDEAHSLHRSSILILFPLAENIEVDYYHAYLAACDPIYPVFLDLLGYFT